MQYVSRQVQFVLLLISFYLFIVYYPKANTIHILCQRLLLSPSFSLSLCLSPSVRFWVMISFEAELITHSRQKEKNKWKYINPSKMGLVRTSHDVRAVLQPLWIGLKRNLFWFCVAAGKSSMNRIHCLKKGKFVASSAVSAHPNSSAVRRT